MTKLAKFALLAAILTLALAAAAQTLTGTVTNGTTNKPAAGDEVIIINLANGMDVGGSTKTDSNGKFSFKLTVAGPHLIRAVHQGVNYHQMAPPGVNTADVQVYDVATKVADLSVTADVIRFQADSGTMQGARLFVVTNGSSPAKTQMNDHNFEFYLPAGAKIEQLQARAPNGQPISADAVPQAEKNRYAIAFPLRPGETQFQVEFTLPYSGEIKIDPKPLYAAAHLVIVLPKTMQFKAADPSSFQSMQDPNQGDSNVEVAQQTKPGQQLSFTLKGNGVITESPGETASGAAQQQEQQPQGRDNRSSDNRSSDNRPGGGLGVPIDAPDALQKYRWPILFGFAVLLAIGGWVVTKRVGPVSPEQEYCPSCGAVGRPQFRKSGSTWIEILLWLLAILPGIIYSIWRVSTKRWVCPKCDQTGMIPLDSPNAPPHVASPAKAAISPSHARAASAPLAAPINGPGASKSPGRVSANSTRQAAVAEAAAVPSPTVVGPKSSMLLEALKEELFQLEVERKQGKITPADYEKAKAALDQTLERALKRQG